MAKMNVSQEALKAYVRKNSSQFLKQENITSVGIGYKMKNGKPTDKLSIQFTVGDKVKPEGLESIGANLIPEFVLIEGVKVPTDVLQRKYKKSAREISLEAVSSRKIVVNPVVPGVSIGNRNISAGTAGCVVYDASDGTPYMLSNWHVFNGPKGNIGDMIVQPGSYDDNRVEKNVVGKLVRSYLGVAGDCAIASIDYRRMAPEVYGLNVIVDRIGEPALGDHVIKSGRTTDITYGIVKRIHVTVRMDYDDAGSQEIGCFEIGPDKEKPAANRQISMGGDSGAAWLSIEKGKPSSMMLGLHFAGEVGDEPDHALACYPKSVFAKLGISPTKPAFRKEDLETGYSPNFIGVPIAIPQAANKTIADDLLNIDGRNVFDYMHFSLAMSKSRKFARWVAWNIDGGSIRKLNRSGIKFRKDPKLPSNAQIGDELYSNNKLDRGHIARRADLLWGTMEEADHANTDSFFFTNITPQHEAFNQSAANGIWGELENEIFANVDLADLRVSVMGGPIFSENDPDYRRIKLPKQFWKIIYFQEQGSKVPQAKGYVLTQADLLNQLEALELPEFSVYEVPISKLSEIAGLTFQDFSATAPKGRRIKLEIISDVEIRRISSVNEILLK